MEALAGSLGRQVPEAMECLRAGLEAGAQFYAFPREHWHRIRSTNGLERFHGEIKRRTRAASAFLRGASPSVRTTHHSGLDLLEWCSLCAEVGKLQLVPRAGDIPPGELEQDLPAAFRRLAPLPKAF